MKVGQMLIDFDNDSTAKSLLFDTGTSYTFVASSVYAIFKAEILSMSYCSEMASGGLILCVCKDDDVGQFPNITFVTKGVEFNVTGSDYLVNTTQLSPVKM